MIEETIVDDFGSGLKLPHSESEERYVLGALMSPPETTSIDDQCVSINDLSPDYFHVVQNRNVFEAIRALLMEGQVPDLTSVFTQLGRMGMSSPGAAYVSSLLDELPVYAVLGQHKKALRDFHFMRSVTMTAKSMLRDVESGSVPPADLVTRYAGQIERDAQGLDGMVSGPAPRLLGSVSDAECQEPDWVWDSYLAPGRITLLAGAPKAGKSTFTGCLAAAVSRGIDFAGLRTTKVPILWIAAEEHIADASRRLLSLGGDPAMIHVLASEPGKPVRGTWNSVRGIGSWCHKNAIGLVVVDTLARMWDVKDENSASEVNRAFSPFLWLARESSAAILVIHHARKGVSDSGDSIRGSSDILSHVDIGLIFSSTGGTERKVQSFSRFTRTPVTMKTALSGNQYVQVI